MDRLTETKQRVAGFSWFGRLNTRELALISVLSSLWIVSEIYMGPVISQVTHVHGVIQRVLGWLLMLVLARLTERFGRVSAMAAIAPSVTRIIRPGRTYALFVGFGYTLGGLAFDLLYFLPIAKNLKGRAERTYLLVISLLSGAIALIPYRLFQFSVLGFYGFLIWIPLDVPDMVKSVALNILGTVIGISILPQIDVWASRVRRTDEKAVGIFRTRELDRLAIAGAAQEI